MTSSPFPVVASRQVADDIERYFAGRDTEVGLFPAAFGNGRVTFCGRRERTEVYLALLRAAKTPASANQGHLFDFSMVLGSLELLKMIDARLPSAPAPSGEGGRLRKMRSAVEKGMALRGEPLPASAEKPKQPAA